MKEQLGMFLIGVIYLSTLYMLVRPNSKGPEIIGNIFTTFTDLVRGVAGQTYNPATGQWSSNG